MSKEESTETMAASAPPVSSAQIDSVVLQRLIEEVRTNEPVMAGSYNRTYNRHNR